MSQPLSAVIIARQAEATIQACVQSLAFCDTVVVGVNDSRDRTAELAAAAGAEVRNVVWRGYGRTKNALLDSMADGWVLSLDADEVVTPGLAREIRETIARPGTLAGYAISRRNYFLGQEIRHGGWRPDWQLRLFRAGSGRFEERPVHEALIVEGSCGRLTQVLDHYSYPSLSAYLDRMNQYTSLAARERAEKGRRFSRSRLFLDPVWTFVKMAFWRAGWKDGFPGMALAAFSALNTLVKHAKHWEMEKNKRMDIPG